MNEAKGTPLSGRPPSEIPLPRAPLVRVLAQIRFPTLLLVNETGKLSEFQEHIRNEYPFFTKNVGQQARVQLGAEGPKVQTSEVVNWRFADDEGDWNWRLTLAQDFVSLETKKYISRVDFLERLSKIITATEEIYKPNLATRIGIRYVDQLRDDAFLQVDRLIESSVMGIFGAIESERIVRGIMELSLRAEEGNLFFRWGQLPENASYDPDTIEAIDTPSWVLDIDMSSDTRHPFAAEQLRPKLQSFAERVYSMFRWVTTDEFLKHFGADK